MAHFDESGLLLPLLPSTYTTWKLQTISPQNFYPNIQWKRSTSFCLSKCKSWTIEKCVKFLVTKRSKNGVRQTHTYICEHQRGESFLGEAQVHIKHTKTDASLKHGTFSPNYKQTIEMNQTEKNTHGHTHPTHPFNAKTRKRIYKRWAASNRKQGRVYKGNWRSFARWISYTVLCWLYWNKTTHTQTHWTGSCMLISCKASSRTFDDITMRLASLHKGVWREDLKIRLRW